jgi:hypothetical protein
MKRSLIVLIALLALSTSIFAAGLEKEVKGRWLGAWVVISSESYSDCGSMATNNRINGQLVKSKGNHRFLPGELAKVNKVDVKKSRVDLHLLLDEPMLLPYQEGPFTLYREAQCKIELEVMLPRESVKEKDVTAIDDAVSAILERHANEEQARGSQSWNEREMEPYPDDYEMTLAALEVWRAEQANLRVEEKLDQARERTQRLAYSVSTDPDYLDGFARGIAAARESDPRDCPTLLGLDLGGSRRVASKSQSSDETSATRSERGYRDGRAFVYGLMMMERLPGCFVPVPDRPIDALAAAQ